MSITLADLAGEVVTAVEPGQLELLAAVTRRWEDGAEERMGRRANGIGGSVGFGVDPAVLSELVYPLLVGTFSQLFGTMAVEGRHRLFRRRRGKALSVPHTRVTVESGQIDAVRAACLEHAETLGLSPHKAEVLADAVAGVLLRTAADVHEEPDPA